MGWGGREKGEEKKRKVKKASEGICMYLCSEPSVKLTTNTPTCNIELNVFPIYQ